MKTKRDPWLARLGAAIRTFEKMEQRERDLALDYLCRRYSVVTVCRDPQPPSEADETDPLYIPPMLRKT